MFFSYCFACFIYFLKIKILPIFSILGYLNAFCCLFVAKLPLTFAKLNSIPLNRARGPLNVYHIFFSPSLLGTRTCKPVAVRLKTMVIILTYTDTYDHILVYMGHLGHP